MTAAPTPVKSSTQPIHSRPPEFTLGTALAWLGHHCGEGCSAALDTLSATIWFIQQSTSPWLLHDDTLIVLDFGSSTMPASRLRRLARQINACAMADGIRVSLHPGDDIDRQAPRLI